MRKQIMNVLITIFLPFVLDGCHDCKDGIGFVPGFWQTWKLTKIISSSKMISTIPYKEYLKIKLVGDNRGNAIIVERLLRDSLSKDTALVASNQWTGYTADCGNTSVIVTFNAHLQRKYLLAGQTLEATGYVNQIGDKSDTAKYFYQLQ